MPTQGRNNVHKLKLIAAIAAVMAASPALSQEITVWDVNVDEPSHAIVLIGRHWSNGGLKLPNHGQDFATLMFTVYPSLLRHNEPSK